MMVTGLMVLWLVLPGFTEELDFPDAEEWPVVDPSELGWKVDRLHKALDYAREQNSTGIVIVDHGRLIVEQYWPIETEFLSLFNLMLIESGDDLRTREDVTTVQKSVVAVLAMIARDKGLLDLDQPVARYLGSGWSSASTEQEATITVRHLMSMTSGLNKEFQYEHPPGHTWKYNTNVYRRIIEVLESVSNMDIGDFTRVYLTTLIGMSESQWRFRWWSFLAPDTGRIGFVSSARDLARFGLLILADGTWDGQMVLENKNYLYEMLLPSQEHNPSYGLLWWLNNETDLQMGDRNISGRLLPTAPTGMVSAQDALSRRVDIIPAWQLVVVRLGDRPEDPEFSVRFWQLLSAALPSRRPGRQKTVPIPSSALISAIDMGQETSNDKAIPLHQSYLSYGGLHN